MCLPLPPTFLPFPLFLSLSLSLFFPHCFKFLSKFSHRSTHSDLLCGKLIGTDLVEYKEQKHWTCSSVSEMCSLYNSRVKNKEAYYACHSKQCPMFSNSTLISNKAEISPQFIWDIICCFLKHSHYLYVIEPLIFSFRCLKVIILAQLWNPMHPILRERPLTATFTFSLILSLPSFCLSFI